MACGTTLESLYLIVLMDKNRYPLFDGFIYRVLRTLALIDLKGANPIGQIHDDRIASIVGCLIYAFGSDIRSLNNRCCICLLEIL